ncbi:hypothetical protein Poli38472_010599 [Pythium oligandrum]|uniref:Uncharacterized protein n=1 Tax=Pythium oligandrum TaxID=41045 RepID=A0A8K1C3D5_PYTOL|nr:hypothetical protein Poli38472_010599 [Pythium oligandrum]|eukprot:TMW55717.1 hypothetical protein Poli38472_010599 [Pythium oligandrum]
MMPSASMSMQLTPPLSPVRRGARGRAGSANMVTSARDLLAAKPRRASDERKLQLEEATSDVSTVTTSSSSTSELTAFVASVEAQWVRRKSQWLSHFKSGGASDDEEDGENDANAENDAENKAAKRKREAHEKDLNSKCHVCNVALRLYRLRHRCRNCGMAVCGVHSKNQVPLPHLGIMKEVRVCDLCTRQLVQRRAGYRSPRTHKKARASSSMNEEELLMAGVAEPSSEPRASRASLSTLPLSPHSPHPVESKESELLGSTSGVLYSCLLEEQANIVDEILYLGTLTMGGRALASRHLNGNVAIWKDRWFMLTSAEMLCFKATTDDDKTGGASLAALGELRSSVHLTDILHIELNDQYPRILTVIRSDGRVFRVRAKTPEQCQEIMAAIKNAQQLFQDAMHRLQRGVQPEDFSISCVTIQHESSLPEQVVASSPLLNEKIQVEMYGSSVLRFYVNGPDTNGVAQYSCQTILLSLSGGLTNGSGQLITCEADPLRAGSWDSKLLRVSLRPSPVSSTFREAMSKQNRLFWTVAVGLVSVGLYAQHRQLPPLEVVVWLLIWMMTLTRFHDPLMLLVTTQRFQRAKRFCVECVEIAHNKKKVASDDDDLAPHDEYVDPRFIEGCNGDIEDAKRRYAETMQWRREKDIDNLLLRSQPHFSAMKASYTHFIHKKDRTGHLVSFEHFGYTKKMREEFLSRGVTEEEAIMHQVFLQEFLWNVVDPRVYPQGTQIKVFDIKGVSMADVSGEVYNFMKNLGTTVAEYNPERMFHIFIVNPPSWFNLIWKVVSPSINPKTRDRVHVVRGPKEVTKALLQFIDEESLPIEYGGKCQCPGGCFTNSPEETDLRNYVESYLNTMEEGDPRIAEALEALKEKYHRQLLPYNKEASSHGHDANTE